MFEYIADLITYNLFKITENTQLAKAVHFFFYDVFKILFLIFIVVTVISFFRTFFSPVKTKEFLSKLKFGTGNILASIFGAVTPFCSCSSIPLFIGFIKARVPLGIAFSFLITSPLVNEIVFVMMGGLFGWKLAFIYAVSGILLGVIAGIVLGALGMEKEIILEDYGEVKIKNNLPKVFNERVKYALKDGKKTFKKLFWFIIVGVGIGAFIHGYIPQDVFMNYIGKYELLSVPIAVLIGIPIYAGCSTVVPIIFSITSNGVPLGTSLAFLMSIAGLSLPEGVILKRIMSMKLLLTFFSVVGIGIILIGYLFNLIT